MTMTESTTITTWRDRLTVGSAVVLLAGLVAAPALALTPPEPGSGSTSGGSGCGAARLAVNCGEPRVGVAVHAAVPHEALAALEAEMSSSAVTYSADQMRAAHRAAQHRSVAAPAIPHEALAALQADISGDGTTPSAEQMRALHRTAHHQDMDPAGPAEAVKAMAAQPGM